MSDFSVSALLLIGHGSSSHGAGARAALEAHADSLRRRNLFGAVACAFLKGGTPPDRALSGLTADTVYIVPHFMSAGYFVSQRIPALLELDGPVTIREGRELRYGRPPALSPPFAGIAARRLVKAAEAAALPHRAPVLVVGHGSTKDRRSADATEALTGRLADLGFLARSCYVETDPPFEKRLWERDGPILVAGFFAADGFHAERDVRALVEKRPETGYTGALGNDPALAELILAETERLARL